MTSISAHITGQDMPHDPQLFAVQRACDELANRLDLTTAVKLLTGMSLFALHGDEELGLAPLVMSDGPTGVRGEHFIGGHPASMLPCAMSLAASWDVDQLREVGAVLASEAIDRDVHVVLGPTINLPRSPLGGRAFESYSEDPLLTGELAAAYVTGMQQHGVSACPKHFVANDSETERMSVDIHVSSRALRELYLRPFEIVNTNASPWSVMAAYNKVNGFYCTEQMDLLNVILKGEWGFDGVVVSDWFATQSTADSARASLDLVMPGPDGPWGKKLVKAVRKGTVSEHLIRDKVSRLLLLAWRTGALSALPNFSTGQSPAQKRRMDATSDGFTGPDDPWRVSSLRRWGARGMTVISNDGTYPLNAEGFTNTPLVVAGILAQETTCSGGGSASLNPPYQVSVVDGLVTALGEQQVKYIGGVGVRNSPPVTTGRLVHVPDSTRPGVKVRAFTGDKEVATVRLSTATTMVGFSAEEPFDEADKIEFSCVTGPIAHTAGDHADGKWTIGVVGAGEWKITVGEHTRDILLEMPSGEDMIDVLTQPPYQVYEYNIEPGTHVNATVKRSDVLFGAVGLVAHPTPLDDHESLNNIATKTADVDVAVVVVGTTDQDETEGTDRATLALPGRQDELVRTVAKAAKRTVVLVNSAAPVLMPWLSEVNTVIVMGFPGQEAGHAVADVLLGQTEACGRLPITYPKSDLDSAVYSVTPTDGVLSYDEDVRVGYRAWYGSSKEPLAWFGHGLGWTTWEYNDIEAVIDGNDIVLLATVKNTGQRAGREVVQVYVDPTQTDDPVRLVGWQSIDNVAPGESRTVAIHVTPETLQAWDDDTHRWRQIAHGRLLVARGLGDTRGVTMMPERRQGGNED